MDPRLSPFLSAAGESERDSHLSDIILLHAGPRIKRVMRRRLGFYVSPSGVNPNNPEAEDLYHDIITKLIQRLNELRMQPDLRAIKDFNHYVIRIAKNACNDYLRAKSPARSRLKYNLRDLLGRHPEFCIWKIDSGEFLCGLPEWRARTGPSNLLINIQQFEERLEDFKTSRFAHTDVRHVPLTRVMTELFEWIGGPIEIEDLVDVAALLLGVKDYPVESLDDDERADALHAADPTLDLDSRSEAKEALRKLWANVRQLPPKQRDVFWLGFEDEGGANLFSRLVNAGLATFPQLAEEVGRPLEVVMSLWQRIPMDYTGIADELGATRQQVIKWRFRALRKLRKLRDLDLTKK